MEVFISFLQDFSLILGEMAPYLLLGFFFAGLLRAFMPKQQIQRFLNSGHWRSSFWAALFGVPLPLCSCGVIPTGAALYRNGASKGSSISFLISTPQTGLDSILATYALLGLPFAIIRPIVSFITGIFGGVMTSKVEHEKPQEVQNKEEQEGVTQLSFLQRVRLLLKYGFVDFIQDISKWLVVGLVLAAVISALLPNDLMAMLSLPPIVQMLIILAVSVPLYICATGSIPLAAILILKGVSPGAAFILLMAGPATNAATITMIGKVLGRKSLFTYLMTITVGALLAGLCIDYLLPATWFTNQLQSMGNMTHDMMSLSWWHIAAGVTLALLIINGYIQKKRDLKTPMEEEDIDKKLLEEQLIVEGMTCNHCKANVENNVAQLPFVDEVRVDLVRKRVYVYGTKIDRNKIKSLITELGYHVKE